MLPPIRQDARAGATTLQAIASRAPLRSARPSDAATMPAGGKAGSRRMKPLVGVSHGVKARGLEPREEARQARTDFYSLAVRSQNTLQSEFHLQARVGFRQPSQKKLRLRPIDELRPPLKENDLPLFCGPYKGRKQVLLDERKRAKQQAFYEAQLLLLPAATGESFYRPAGTQTRPITVNEPERDFGTPRAKSPSAAVDQVAEAAVTGLLSRSLQDVVASSERRRPEPELHVTLRPLEQTLPPLV